MISIITPTFNRAYILPQCYKSLCNQSVKDFEWIVADDGSTDTTEQLVKGFIDEDLIDIKYYHQNNGGKHRAHNLAVKHASGELTVCLDSDDQFAPNAVERAIITWRQQQETNNIGILALRGDFDSHKPICSHIPYGLHAATMTELRDNYGFEGDTILFFKTDLLKQQLFKEFDGEKFLPEANLYCELDLLGTMILLNEVLYYCEYRSDGLTVQYHKLLFDNPKGTADTYYKMSRNASSIYKAFKYAIIAQAYNCILPKAKRLKFKDNSLLMNLANIGVPFFTRKYLNRFKK